jgi:hypothetical protein
MRRHFRFQPVRDLMRIKPDGASHAEKWDVVVFHFLVQCSHGNAEQTRQFFDRKSLLSGAQLLNEGHLRIFSGLTSNSIRSPELPSTVSSVAELGY